MSTVNYLGGGEGCSTGHGRGAGVNSSLSKVDQPSPTFSGQNYTHEWKHYLPSYVVDKTMLINRPDSWWKCMISSLHSSFMSFSQKTFCNLCFKAVSLRVIWGFVLFWEKKVFRVQMQQGEKSRHQFTKSWEQLLKTWMSVNSTTWKWCKRVEDLYIYFELVADAGEKKTNSVFQITVVWSSITTKFTFQKTWIQSLVVWMDGGNLCLSQSHLSHSHENTS